MSSKKTAENKKVVKGEKAVKEETKVMILPPKVQGVLEVEVYGEALLTCRYSEEAKRGVREGQALGDEGKGTKGPRPPRDPQREFELARYVNKDGVCCVKSIAFKKAMSLAAAGRGYATAAKTTLFVKGDLLPILNDKTGKPLVPQLREDNVMHRSRFGKVPDLTYRPEFINWRVKLIIEYKPERWEPETVINLLRITGDEQGIGAWRPSCGGQHGRFQVDFKTVRSGVILGSHKRAKLDRIK